jgi:hypothetical protein
MAKLTFICIFAFHALLAMAQTPFYTVRKVSDKEMSFPVFSGKNEVAVQKINRLLQLSELDQVTSATDKNIFKSVTGDLGGIYGGKVEMRFNIISNNKKVLAIQFDEASCGMTCYYYNRYYNFNAANGDLIQLKDLFTVAGFAAFKKEVSSKRIRAFEAELRSNKILPGDLEYIKDCYKADELSDFYINSNSIFIDGWNCFHKNDKGFTIETETGFRLQEFRQHLNEYGKAVFGLTGKPLESFHSPR